VLLDKIVYLFNGYYSALEKQSAVRVITAIKVKEDFQQKLAQALTKRIHRQVTLHCETDPTLLGGAIIHIGDSVIDGSIRGKLSRLLEFTLR
jgi:F-type H+-transporting ATPase subunit delta